MPPRKTFSPFGLQVKHRLLDLDKNDIWLYTRMNEESKLHAESSFLSRILHAPDGSLESSKKLIDKILLEEESKAGIDSSRWRRD